MKGKELLVAAALAAFVGCPENPPPGPPPAADTATVSSPKHACRGQNACAGQGGCGSTKGKNECKGKGECGHCATPTKK